MNNEIIDTATINKSLGIFEKIISKLEGTNLVIIVLAFFIFILLLFFICRFFPKDDNKSISTSGNSSPIVNGSKNSIHIGKKED